MRLGACGWHALGMRLTDEVNESRRVRRRPETVRRYSAKYYTFTIRIQDLCALSGYTLEHLN